MLRIAAAVLLTAAAWNCRDGKERPVRKKYVPPKSAAPRTAAYTPAPMPIKPPAPVEPPEKKPVVIRPHVPDPVESPETPALAGELYIQAVEAYETWSTGKKTGERKILRRNARRMINDALNAYAIREVLGEPSDAEKKAYLRRLLERLKKE